MAKSKRTGAVLLALTTLAGCGTRQVEVAVPQCEQLDGVLQAGFDSAELWGQFDLTLVATSGDSSQRKTEGALELMAVDSALSKFVADSQPAVEIPYRLVGTATVSVGAIGATNTGELGSLDPTRPGVAVLQGGDVDSPEVMLRFGALANRVDITLFDGGYLALTVAWADSLGFGGTWASGVRGPEAGGYFCAFRPVTGN